MRKKIKTVNVVGNAESQENIEEKLQSEIYQHIRDAKSFDEQVWVTF